MRLSRKVAMAMRVIVGVLVLSTAVGVMGCGGEAPPSAATDDVQVDTTESGWVHVRHGALPDRVAWHLVERTRLGSAGVDDTASAFGDVRGVELFAGDQMAVLDYQAGEIRLFDLDGTYRGALAGPGQGPGELGRSNGLFLAADGGLWVNDHGNARLSRFHPTEDVRTVRRFVHSYGYLWQGAVDADGRVWDFDIQSLGDADRSPGVVEGGIAHWIKVYDPATEGADSTRISIDTGRGIALPRGSMAIPFDAQTYRTFDPVGGGVWTGRSDVFRLVRLSYDGDTLAVIEAEVPPVPVTPAERRDAVDRAEDFMERAGRVDVDWDEVIPAHKPLFDQLVVDDAGRLWVRRSLDEGVVYHVFEADGRYRGRVHPDFAVHGYFVPRIRGDTYLGLVTDDLDVPYVLRATLEDPAGR